MNSIILKDKQAVPSKIVCIGRNYVDHIKELNNEIPIQPVIFMKPNSSISNALKFNDFDAIHYEAEISFAVEFGKLVAVGFGLDLTKRELQSQLKAKGLPWERAKAFDGSTVFSEFVRFENVQDLRLELFINGELKQAGGYDLMLCKPDDIFNEINTFMTLVDNDIIMTGTPKGVGKIYLGDVFVGKIYEKDNMLISTTWTVNS